MEFANGNLARETGRAVDEWQGPVWSDRYAHIPISPEPEALVERLRYLLSIAPRELRGLETAELPRRQARPFSFWYLS